MARPEHCLARIALSCVALVFLSLSRTLCSSKKNFSSGYVAYYILCWFTALYLFVFVCVCMFVRVPIEGIN